MQGGCEKNLLFWKQGELEIMKITVFCEKTHIFHEKVVFLLDFCEFLHFFATCNPPSITRGKIRILGEPKPSLLGKIMKKN
jgi:hypothetical protein